MNVPRPSGTCAIPRRTMSSVARPAMRAPSKRISPAVRTMPHTARNVVVLPAPLAPRIVVIPPSSTANRIPCSTLVQPYRASRRSEEHTSELQSQSNLVCRLLLEKKKKKKNDVARQDQLNKHRHNSAT